MIRSRPSARAANRNGTVATCSAMADTARYTKATWAKGLLHTVVRLRSSPCQEVIACAPGAGSVQDPSRGSC